MPTNFVPLWPTLRRTARPPRRPPPRLLLMPRLQMSTLGKTIRRPGRLTVRSPGPVTMTVRHQPATCRNPEPVNRSRWSRRRRSRPIPRRDRRPSTSMPKIFQPQGRAGGRHRDRSPPADSVARQGKIVPDLAAVAPSDRHAGAVRWSTSSSSAGAATSCGAAADCIVLRHGRPAREPARPRVRRLSPPRAARRRADPVVEGNVEQHGERICECRGSNSPSATRHAGNLFVDRGAVAHHVPPGEAVLFRTRLASPPADAHD